MKAKELNVFTEVYYVRDIDNILIYHVSAITAKTKEQVEVCFKECDYWKEKFQIAPDAHAIQDKRIYFDLKAAQTKQLRMRKEHIANAEKSLINAAKAYSVALSKYETAPASEPRNMK